MTGTRTDGGRNRANVWRCLIVPRVDWGRSSLTAARSEAKRGPRARFVLQRARSFILPSAHRSRWRYLARLARTVGLLTTTVLVGLIAAPVSARALTPAEGESVPFGTLITGACSGDNTGWFLFTLEPQRTVSQQGGTLLAPYPVPTPAADTIGYFPQWGALDTPDSAWHGYGGQWNWVWVGDAGSDNRESGSGCAMSTGSAGTTFASDGLYANDSVASNGGVTVNLPGPYLLMEATLSSDGSSYTIDSVIHFNVLNAPGSCPTTPNTASFPLFPYIDQYDAGAFLPLPVRNGKPGGNACGPSALLMGMLDSLGGTSDIDLPSLPQVFDDVMQHARAASPPETPNKFQAARALQLVQGLGWRNAYLESLGSQDANVADACDPASTTCQQPDASNEATIDAALTHGPVVLSTNFGVTVWGKTGGGHMILVEGIDPRYPGEYIVDDPAGDYFSSPQGPAKYYPSGHYGAGSCGYEVDYPKSWVLAYTTGKYLLALGQRSDASLTKYAAIGVTDPGGPNSPSSFYLEDASGDETGFVNGSTLDEIPGSWAGNADPWPADVGDDGDAGSTSRSAAAADDSTTTSARALSVSDPQPGLTLHIVGGSSGTYDLSVDAWTDGEPTAHDDLSGPASTGEDQILASPALESLIGPGSTGGNGSTTGSSSPGVGSAGGGGSLNNGTTSSSTASPAVKLLGATLKRRSFKRNQGTTLIIALSAAGSVRLGVTRIVNGHRRGKACVARGSGKRCSVMRYVSQRVVSGTAGVIAIAAFGKGFPTGTYTVTLTPAGQGASGGPVAIRFTVR